MINRLENLIEVTVNFIIYKILRLNLPERSGKNAVQFVKFGIVGILNNLVSYVTYILLIKFGLHYIPANIIGFSVSVFNSYYWNNRYVFVTDEHRVWWKTFLKTYISYAGTGIILSNLLLMLWIEVLHISSYIAPVINLIITVPLNFLLNKFWAYKK